MSNRRGNVKNLIPMPTIWRHQPTKSIRLPEVFVEKVLAYAHQLDEEIPEQRIEIINGRVAIFSPYDPRGYFQEKARSIKGWRFHRGNYSWWYPLEKLEEVLAVFPEWVVHENVIQVIQTRKVKQEKANEN